MWAGLRERFELDTLIWALRNAGGDKTAVITQLISFLSLRISGLSHRETNRLFKELAEIRDEAEQSHNLNQLAFVKDVEKNPMLGELIQSYRRVNPVASRKK